MKIFKAIGIAVQLFFISSSSAMLQDGSPESTNINNISEKYLINEVKMLPEFDGIGGVSDYMGRSLSAKGNRALIGAPIMQGHGIVYVMELVDGNWIKSSLLKPSDGQAGDFFGNSVSIHNNIAVIGAYGNDSFKGAVYVFTFEEGQWNETAKITASDGKNNMKFGNSVAIYGSRIVVGAPLDEVNGSKVGASYVYELISGNWLETAKLSVDDSLNYGWYGFDVDISETKIAISAYKNAYDEIKSGLVYLYELDSNSAWSLTQMIYPNERYNGMEFGFSLSLENNALLVGAPNVNSAYYFTRNSSGEWLQKNKIIQTSAGNQNGSEKFGQSVNLSGTFALIGSNKNTSGLTNSGSAFLFQFNRLINIWYQEAIFEEDEAVSYDYYGLTVAITNNSIFIGAPEGETATVNPLNVNSGVYLHEKKSNGWMFSKKIKASQGAPYGQFGYSVDIFENNAIVGMSSRLGPSNLYNNVYLYQHKDGKWMLKNKIQIEDNTGHFGLSVGVSREWAVVTAGIGENQFIYIYKLIENEWVFNKKIKIDGTDEYLPAATIAVDIYESRIVVGSPSHQYNGRSPGAVLVFELHNSNWIKTATIRAGGIRENYFGSAVSLNNNRLLVGAKRAQNSRLNRAGLAYIYDLVNGQWTRTALLSSDEPALEEHFGASVSLFENRALVGSDKNYDNSNATARKAYLFDFVDGQWQEPYVLRSGIDSYNDKFGKSVSLSGNHVIVSAPTSSTNGKDSGLVYDFIYSQGNWLATAKDIETSNSNLLGWSTALYEEKLIAGSVFDNERGTKSGSAQIVNLANYTNIQNSHSALWFNPEQSGHGLNVYMLEDNKIIVIWYVYDQSGLPLWLMGIGTHDNKKALLDVSILNGGLFPPNFQTEDVQLKDWGQFEIGFYDCNNGLFKWTPKAGNGFAEGGMTITRITTTLGLDCTEEKDVLSSDNHSSKSMDLNDSNTEFQAAHSALWYNPEESGHGISIYMLPENKIVAFWYVYDHLGNPMWLYGQGSYDSLTANIEVNLASNGAFPPNFDSNNVNFESWGRFNIEFTSCDSGLFKWFPNEGSLYDSGEMIISRLTSTSGLECNEFY